MHHAEDFFERSFAVEGAQDAVHEHGDIAVFDRFFFELEIEGARHNEFLNFFVEFQHFAQDEAFFVSGAVTLFAAAGNPMLARNTWNRDAGFFIEETQNFLHSFFQFAVKRRFFLAVAEFAHEALRHIGAARVYDVVGAHAHGDEARNRTGGVVGVKGGDHEVTGEGRLEGDGCCFVVADFADHDDIRILPQERTERG